MPERAQWIRTLFAELNRIHSHLIYLGTSGVELGAMSVFFYCLRERDTVLDLFEMVTGVRMHDRYPQFGGVAEDLPKGFYAECTQVLRDDARAASTSTSTCWPATRSGRAGYQGIGTIDAETAIAMGLSGPNLRASGVPYDLRRNDPYLAYDQLEFDVITGENGDAYDRFLCRTQGDVRVGARSSSSASTSMPSGPVMADDRKYVLPPRDELHTSMESLIHHFKLVTEGFRVAAGPGLLARSSRRAGEFGCYLVVGRRPQAVADPLPRAELRQPAGDGDDVGQPLRRRHDRRRRLARRRHGGGRPVSDARSGHRRDAGRRPSRRGRRCPPPLPEPDRARPLRDRILDVVALYPEPRSAIIPALRLAQDEYGWLSTEAFEQVADATGFTPALCKSVASFYDMFRLHPAGAHEICVCTNISCALVGAGDTLREFERELGIHAGETTADGAVHAAHGRVLRRLRLGPGGRGRRALPRAVRARPGGRAGGRAAGGGVSERPTRILLDFEGDRRDIHAYEQARRLRSRCKQGARDGAGRHRRAPSTRSGLRGRGGAGFPTGRKASFLPKDRKPAYLCVNADESEPGTFKDREIMLRNPHALIEGVLIMSYGIGATSAFIYIRGEYRTEFEVLKRALEEARSRGYVGRNVLGSGYDATVVLHRGAGAYICGEETALLQLARGRARPAALEAAVPGRRRPLRRADAGEQRRDAGLGALHPGDGRRGLRRDRHRALEGHARVLALGQRQAARATTSCR